MIRVYEETTGAFIEATPDENGVFFITDYDHLDGLKLTEFLALIEPLQSVACEFKIPKVISLCSN